MKNLAGALVVIGGLAAVLTPGVWAGGGTVELVAGGKGPEGGPAPEARLDGPFGIVQTPKQELFLVEISGHRVLKIDRQGILTRLAGTGEKGAAGDGGPARSAQFNGMHSLDQTPDGDLLIADTWNHCVRRIDLETGKIFPFAGTGTKGFSGDGGPAVAAQFGGIYCVAVNPRGTRALLTDLDNRRIRAVDLRTGMVTTVAGNGQKGKPQDGAPAIAAPLVDPRAAIEDPEGNLYILERGGHALRRVDGQGRIQTLIGDGKTDVALRGPKHLCLDLAGDVLIADTDNHRILKYRVRENRVVPVAGRGKPGTAGVGGPPDQLELNQPHGVHMPPSGELFIVDSMNHRVLKLAP